MVAKNISENTLSTFNPNISVFQQNKKNLKNGKKNSVKESGIGRRNGEGEEREGEIDK